MEIDGTEFRSSGPVSFSQALQKMEYEGGSALIVGDAGLGPSQAISRKLFGGADERRYCLLLQTEASPDSSTEDWFPGQTTDPETGCVHVKDFTTPARGASHADGGQVQRGVMAESDGPDAQGYDLSAIRDELTGFVGDLHSKGVDSSTNRRVRISLYSLAPLLQVHDTDTVSEWLHGMFSLTEGVNAIAQYHLPLPTDCRYVEDLRDEFDIVIELKPPESDADADAVGKQQWTIVGQDETTEWFTLYGNIYGPGQRKAMR